ncbi:MAG: hypothetical protein JNL26_03120 [Gemmatimonadetes bacterium]|nr:hypothetical protein [Gemmatimonadota bacterium]
MGFISRLVLFALGLTVILGAYRIVEKVRRPSDHVVVDVDVAEAPEPPAAAEAPAVAEMPSVVEAPAVADVALPPLRRGEVRILTTNHSAFMALRDDQLVAGLTDSIRAHVRAEMRRELDKSKAGGVGAAIGKVVAEGVNKLLEGEIQVPVSDVRDISYDGRRIVIRYRNEPKGLNFESIKSEGDRTILEQFSEEDARRFVRAVQVRVK